MKLHLFRLSSAVIALSLAVLACSFAVPAISPTNTPSIAQPSSQNDGPKIVTGSVTYTNSFFTEGVAEPEIILEDEGGFITRNRKFLIPIESQVIGQITSDFYTSPFTYSLALPAEPNGTLHDVNHDDKKDTGVMVFVIAYWTNTWGDPYLEKRDQDGGGWSSAYASTKVSSDRNSYLEVYGGKYLVYVPDDKQQFPSGFGGDKKLFTNDDPIMNIPAGWSVVDMDQSPFKIDRAEKPTIDLYEPANAANDDFSKLSYSQAFDKMVDKFKKEYAWTELKKIDWDAKAKEFRPRFEDAEKKNDPHAYALALRDFIWSIPDTHVGFDESLITDDFRTDTAGGLGFAMRETDDGKIIANYILAGGPADKAGMKWGAEIISLDGKPVGDVVDAAIPWSSPFSNLIVKRLQQLRYALRFKLDKGQVEVKITACSDQSCGSFNMAPGDQKSMLPPRPELQFSGPVAVLVGPSCASACEFFSYNMTINNRAAIIGQYPTEGAGGSVEQFLMPENISTQITIGRAVDAQENIHLEGKGVVPTVKVPVTTDTLQKEANGEDVILDAAVAFLNK